MNTSALNDNFKKIQQSLVRIDSNIADLYCAVDDIKEGLSGDPAATVVPDEDVPDEDVAEPDIPTGQEIVEMISRFEKSVLARQRTQVDQELVLHYSVMARESVCHLSEYDRSN